MKRDWKRKHFLCDCRWAAHGLTIEQDEDGYLDIYITNSRWDLSLWQRIKAAYKLIVGHDHTMSAIILDRDSLPEFVDFVVSLRHNPSTE